MYLQNVKISRGRIKIENRFYCLREFAFLGKVNERNLKDGFVGEAPEDIDNSAFMVGLILERFRYSRKLIMFTRGKEIVRLLSNYIYDIKIDDKNINILLNRPKHPLGEIKLPFSNELYLFTKKEVSLKNHKTFNICTILYCEYLKHMNEEEYEFVLRGKSVWGIEDYLSLSFPVF